MLKTELNSDNLAEFLRRFGNFHDAVIHHVIYDVFSPTLVPTQAHIVIGVQDGEVDNWVNLTLEVLDVTKLILKKPLKQSISIIFKVHISFFEGNVYLNFFPITSHPTSIEDYEDYNQPNWVNFVIVGKKCLWHISPYKERSAVP